MPLHTIYEEPELELERVKMKKSPSHHRIKAIRERATISPDTFLDLECRRDPTVTPPHWGSPTPSDSPIFRSSPVSFFQEDPRLRISHRHFEDRVEMTVGKAGTLVYFKGVK